MAAAPAPTKEQRDRWAIIREALLSCAQHYAHLSEDSAALTHLASLPLFATLPADIDAQVKGHLARDLLLHAVDSAYADIASQLPLPKTPRKHGLEAVICWKLYMGYGNFLQVAKVLSARKSHAPYLEEPISTSEDAARKHVVRRMWAGTMCTEGAWLDGILRIMTSVDAELRRASVPVTPTAYARRIATPTRSEPVGAIQRHPQPPSWLSDTFEYTATLSVSWRDPDAFVASEAKATEVFSFSNRDSLRHLLAIEDDLNAAVAHFLFELVQPLWIRMRGQAFADTGSSANQFHATALGLDSASHMYLKQLMNRAIEGGLTVQRGGPDGPLAITPLGQAMLMEDRPRP